MITQARNAVLEMAGGNIDAGMQRILARFIELVRARSERTMTEHSAPLFVAFARAYARMFTRDELVEIRAFISTPTGAKYIRQAVNLLSDPDVAQANTAYMTSAFSALQPLLADLGREAREYLESRSRR